MEKEFTPYELALALKELDFDEPCFNYYDGDKNKNSINLGNGYVTKYMVSDNFTIAPTFSQAFRFFREKYKLDKTIDSWTEQPMDGEIWDKAYQYYINGESYHPYFKTYEEVEFECLKKLIEIVKEK